MALVSLIFHLPSSIFLLPPSFFLDAEAHP
jgi:hypothetical protein